MAAAAVLVRVVVLGVTAMLTIGQRIFVLFGSMLMFCLLAFGLCV